MTEAQRGSSRTGDGSLYERVRHGIAHLGQAGFQGEQAAIRWLGTAFIVDDRCAVVTAKHAIEGIPEDQLVLRFLGKEEGTVRTFPARIVRQTEGRDLAFLSFGPVKKSKRWCTAEGFRPIPIHDNSDLVGLAGQSVRVVGYPALEGTPPRDIPIVRFGGIASAQLEWQGRPMLLLDLTGVPGFSGAPVILESTGESIGVVYGPGRTERVYDFEWATPLTPADFDAAHGD